MDLQSVLVHFAVVFLMIFLILPVHEFAHAGVAYLLGDKSIKYRDRLSLNPIKHIDITGALCMLLLGFGWAKPVPIHPGNFKKPKLYMGLTALAGPVSNITLAFLFMLASYIIVATGNAFEGSFSGNLATVCTLGASCNITLAVFNLLPVPPLDGSRILNVVLPDRQYYKIMQYERQIGLVFIVLVLTGTLDGIISFFSNLLYEGLNFIVSIPFNLFF
jgi:Zn-dependent protease